MTIQPEQVSTRVLTVPNVISAARISLIPVFAWLFLTGDHDLAAVVILIIIGSTDWVDGFVARRTGQVSVLGKILDPIADRAAIIVVLLTFMFRGTVPLWIAGVILLRDVIVSIAFPILESRGYPRIPVNKVGKLATLLIYTGFGVAAAGVAVEEVSPWTDPGKQALLAAGAILYWVAGYLYVKELRKVRPTKVKP